MVVLPSSRVSLGIAAPSPFALFSRGELFSFLNFFISSFFLRTFVAGNDILNTMEKPIVSIIMGSTSDLPVMEKAAKFLDEMGIPFEMNAFSAHRTPTEVEAFARTAEERGLKVIIAGAGMAAALPGVVAASTTLPVIGVPIKGMLDGLDAMLSIIQMPPGIPVATVGINGAQNAAILAAEMLALSDETLAQKLRDYKQGLKEKIVKANAELKEVKYNFKTN